MIKFFNFFKRKFKDTYKQAINKKIAYPELTVLCPKCKKTLNYSPIGNVAEVRCTSKKCIMGDSRGNYKFQ